MRIKWLRTALRNLDEEATYIALDNEAAAQTVVARVMAAVTQLWPSNLASGDPVVPDTRELVVLKTRYIVPYRVRGDGVSILCVFHTSRRLP